MVAMFREIYFSRPLNSQSPNVAAALRSLIRNPNKGHLPLVSPTAGQSLSLSLSPPLQFMAPIFVCAWEHNNSPLGRPSHQQFSCLLPCSSLPKTMRHFALPDQIQFPGQIVFTPSSRFLGRLGRKFVSGRVWLMNDGAGRG